MSLRGKKILVTGAGGFIGSHLCEALAKEGSHVRAFLRYTSQQDLRNLDWIEPSVLKSINILRGDLVDADSVRRAVRGCSIVFHLGALISVPYSFESPLQFMATNSFGTAHVMLAALEAGASRIIHTSTSEVFGTGKYVPMDEIHPTVTQSPYAASKLGADKLVESFFWTYQLPVVTLRPFNTFGPRQSPRAIIPTIITQALHGQEIRLGSLDPRRDMTFVADTVRGFIRAAEAAGVEGELINLGTGKMWSVRELVDRIGAILGKKLTVVPDKGRIRPGSSEVLRLQCNARKAQRLLGWKARISLDQGLTETIRWLENHPELHRIGVYHV
jgi:NAD dependent epimerase/dehydratase